MSKQLGPRRPSLDVTSSFRRAMEEHHAGNPEPGSVEDEASSPAGRLVLEWIGEGKRVVDLGSHLGTLGEAVRRAGNDVVLVDLPVLAAGAARAYGPPVVAHNLNQPFPFADESFDVVLGSSILDYIPADLAFLLECRRVLVDGGALVLVVPNEFSLPRRIRSAAGRATRDFSDPSGYHSFNRYTSAGLEELLGTAGFDRPEVRKVPRRPDDYRLLNWLERILPTSLATDFGVRAVKPASPTLDKH